MRAPKPLDELINLVEPAWPELVAEMTACPSAEMLPIDLAAGRRCFHAIQVTTRSRMGAMALHCGGIVLDYGWLRSWPGIQPRPAPTCRVELMEPILTDALGLPAPPEDAAVVLGVSAVCPSHRYVTNVGGWMSARL